MVMENVYNEIVTFMVLDGPSHSIATAAGKAYIALDIVLLDPLNRMGRT